MKRFFTPFRISSRQLGPLEERVLEGLWVRGSSTVRELLEDGNDDLAYTTLMTTLDRLFKKNLLTRVSDGRAFRYSPRLTREELHRETAARVFRQFLDATPGTSLPLSYLVEILTERDTHLLDDLRKVVESKQIELLNRETQKEADGPRKSLRKKEND